MDNTSYMRYNSHGFWIHQTFVEVLSEYICETFENIGLNTFSSNLLEIYDDCNSNRKGENIGMVNISFNDYILTQSYKDTINNVFEAVKVLILSKGTEISLSMLDQFESNKSDTYFKTSWVIPIKSQSLVTTINSIQKMINGTMLPDMISLYYIGFDNPDGVIEI